MSAVPDPFLTGWSPTLNTGSERRYIGKTTVQKLQTGIAMGVSGTTWIKRQQDQAI